jgi:hypothetical protein
MVLRALEQGLGSYWLRLETLKVGYQHVLKLFPLRDHSRIEGRISHLSRAPDCHDEGFHHDSRVATI